MELQFGNMGIARYSFYQSFLFFSIAEGIGKDNERRTIFMTTEEKRRQTERIAQAISKLPPETVERLDLIVMGAAMVAPKQAEGKG